MPKTKPIDYEYYCFDVNDWKGNYSFSPDNTKHRADDYMETSSLTIIGTLNYPEKFRYGPDIELMIYGDREIDKN